MEQAALEYQYPPKIKVPRGLKTIIESFSRAVVERQPESVPHFVTLYFSELMRFREGHEKEEIQLVVKKFHESRVARLPNRGLGTMKNVTARKPPAVANAALFIIRTQKMQQTSGSITVKSADNNKKQHSQTLPEPKEAQVADPSQNVKSKTQSPKMAEVAMRLRPTKDNVKKVKKDIAVTKKASDSGQSTQKPELSTKPRKKKKAECKLVMPAVPTEEPEVENLDVILSASGPEHDTPVLDSSQVPVAEEDSASHLASLLIQLEAKHSHLVYPPLPDKVLFSAEQQITQATSQEAVPVSQHSQLGESSTDVSPESDGEDMLELESELAADHSSATLTSERKYQGDNKLVRPIAPAEDPELRGVADEEWVPPKMEDVVVAELINQQLKRLLSAKRKVAHIVKQKASASSQQRLNSHSTTDHDAQEESSHLVLSQTLLSEEEAQTGPKELPSSSQKDLASGTTEAPPITASHDAQQIVYWTLCLTPVQFSPPPVCDSAAPSGTTEAPTTGPQPLGAVFQLPQHAMHTYTGTGQSSSPMGMPAMVLPVFSPQTWGLCPVTPLHSAGAPAGQCGAAGPSEPCQATQNTQQASSHTQEPMPANQKCSTYPRTPVVMMTPSVHTPCPSGANTLPMNHSAHSRRASQEGNHMPLHTAVSSAVHVHQAPVQGSPSSRGIPENSPQKGR